MNRVKLVLAGCLCAGIASSCATVRGDAGPAADTRAHYRWTGAAADNRWSEPGNWQASTGAGGRWEKAEPPPPAQSIVVLGDAAPDAPQAIELDCHAEAARLLFEATGARAYTLRSWADPEDTGIDSNSGMLYSLRLSDPVPVVQAPAAVADLTIRVEVVFTTAGNPLIRLLSRKGARVIAENRLRTTGTIEVDQGRDGATGTLVERGFRPTFSLPRE
jgi:hypothetical protein